MICGLTSGSSAPRLNAAWAEVERAQMHLAGFGSVGLRAGGAGSASGAPLSAQTLLAQIGAAQALHDTAAANLASLKNGARAEQVDAAQAQLDALDLQLEKLTLTLPKIRLSGKENPPP